MTSLVVVGQPNITLGGLVAGSHVLDGYSSMTLTGTGPVSIEQRTITTFSGTSTAAVSVSLPGGASKSCKVDLAVAQPVCA